MSRDRNTEGEIWARQQLELLRERKGKPAAIVAFLAASRERAAENRAARPVLVRQARRWMWLGAAAWVVPAAFGAKPFRGGLKTGLPWWAATSAMLDWHLGMFETEDGRARSLGPADALTLGRAWLVPMVALSPAPLPCAVGGLSDVLDGVLARSAEPTRAGRDLEGLVDACFSLATLRGLTRTGRLDRRVAMAEAIRLSAGTVLATFNYFATAEAPDQRLVHAARSAGVIRWAGLMLSASGSRRTGGVVLAAGSLASIGLTSLALKRRSDPEAQASR